MPTTTGLERGIRVLERVAARPTGCAFNELRRLTGSMPAPTLSRLLKTLIREDLIVKDGTSGRYRLGNAALRLARVILGAVPTRDLLQPAVDWLADATRQSAAYFEREQDRIVLIAKREHPESWHYMPVFGTNPKITRNGFAQVCLAFLDDSTRTELLKKSRSSLPLPRQDFLARLSTIRQNHEFLEQGEAAPELARVVAPVFVGTSGPFAGAIGITALRGALDKPALAHSRQSVRAAAETATRELGVNLPAPSSLFDSSDRTDLETNDSRAPRKGAHE